MKCIDFLNRSPGRREPTAAGCLRSLFMFSETPWVGIKGSCLHHCHTLKHRKTSFPLPFCRNRLQQRQGGEIVAEPPRGSLCHPLWSHTVSSFPGCCKSILGAPLPSSPVIPEHPVPALIIRGRTFAQQTAQFRSRLSICSTLAFSRFSAQAGMGTVCAFPS